MKKALVVAAALGLLSLPALAQQTPNGNSSGGPARVGEPGQVGAGMAGAQPGMQPGMARSGMKRTMHRKKKMMRRHRKAM